MEEDIRSYWMILRIMEDTGPSKEEALDRSVQAPYIPNLNLTNSTYKYIMVHE